MGTMVTAGGAMANMGGGPLSTAGEAMADLAGGPLSVLGWTLVHSVWQAALVAAALALVLRLVPVPMVRSRVAASTIALATVLGLAAGTWGALQADWRAHDACWDSAEFALAHPATCAGHGVPAARRALAAADAPDGRTEPKRAVTPWAWFRLGNLPRVEIVAPAALDVTAWASWIALAWGGLALLAAIRLLVGLGRLRGVVARSESLEDDRAQALLDRVRRRMGVGKAIELRASTKLSSPAVAGWRRPVILLPRGISTRLAPMQLACVLGHECVHVRRGHFAANLAQRALECVLAANPFGLWISRRIRDEREALCDRLAAGQPATGASRREYCETLMRLEMLRSPAGPAYIGLLGEGPLLRRIRRLVDPAAPGPGARLRRVGAAALGALTLGLLLVQASVAAMVLSSWAVMERDIHVREATPTAPEAAAPPRGAPGPPLAWDMVKKDVPALEANVRRLLEELDD